MKRKITLTFLTLSSLSMLLSLGACKKSPYSGKVALDYGQVRLNALGNITELAEISYDDLVAKIETAKESFMLVVYNKSCSCWNDFQPVITKYINEYNAKVEYIDAGMFTGKEKTFDIHLSKISLPNVVLFKRGELYKQAYLKNENTDKMFTQYSAFKEWVDENIISPRMYYLDKETLDSYIASNRTFDLYVARSECGDCQAINYNVLYDYFEDHMSLKNYLYIFDIQQYRGTDQYQPIKDQYGLTTVNNPVLGYDLYGGCVPTFQHREGNNIKDMITVLNDKVSEGVISSYFTTERCNAMTFLGENKASYVFNGTTLQEASLKEYYEKHHYAVVMSFFDYYLL